MCRDVTVGFSLTRTVPLNWPHKTHNPKLSAGNGQESARISTSMCRVMASGSVRPLRYMILGRSGLAPCERMHPQGEWMSQNCYAEGGRYTKVWIATVATNGLLKGSSREVRSHWVWHCAAMRRTLGRNEVWRVWHSTSCICDCAVSSNDQSRAFAFLFSQS